MIVCEAIRETESTPHTVTTNPPSNSPMSLWRRRMRPAADGRMIGWSALSQWPMVARLWSEFACFNAIGLSSPISATTISFFSIKKRWLQYFYFFPPPIRKFFPFLFGVLIFILSCARHSFSTTAKMAKAKVQLFRRVFRESTANYIRNFLI